MQTSKKAWGYYGRDWLVYGSWSEVSSQTTHSQKITYNHSLRGAKTAQKYSLLTIRPIHLSLPNKCGNTDILNSFNIKIRGKYLII